MTLNDDDDQVQPNQNARMLQLENEFLRYNLDILGVSEARWRPLVTLYCFTPAKTKMLINQQVLDSW